MRLRIAGIVLCGLAAAAHADRADQLFKKGKKLLAEKKYAEACTAFEQSDRIDPEIGAKLNVARCYQEWGKLATAWRWYIDAEQMASKAGDERAPKIRALIDDLDRDVPRLTLRLPPDAITERVEIRLDGVALEFATLGDERRVDPGRHEIDTVVDGEGSPRKITVDRGSKLEVPLQVPTRRSPPRPAPDRPAPVAAPATDRGRTRRLIGLGASGAGAVAVGFAGILTLRARSDYQHALAGYCSGAIDMCDDTGLSRTHSARHRANIATAVTLGGLAAVAAGLVVYFTTPAAERGDRAEPARHALYLGPALGGDGAGVVVGGAF